MRDEDYRDLYELEENFWWFAGMREITSALLDSFCRPASADRRVLDAGCGTGGMLDWLARYAGRERVFGIDYSGTALDYSRARGHARLAQASVTHLPFADAQFDLVTSFDVLVQVPGAGADEVAMREMNRVLRDDGIAFVRVAAYDWMRSGHDEALNTQRRYRLTELTEKMRRANFKILRATYANSFLFPAAVLKRHVLKPFGLAGSGSDVKPLAPNLSWLNRALSNVLGGEANLLKMPGARLPAGLSAICVAQKLRG